MPQRIYPGNWFSIGMFAGPSPLELAPAPGAANPVLTYRDVSDAPAIFVADPFIVYDGGRWYMLLEVMNDAGYKGEISVATSANGIQWEYEGIVLTEPFSLSYPYVFDWQGDYYMLPEMYQQNYLRLYKAESFPRGWRPVATFLEGDPIADASIFQWQGSWYILACSNPAGNDTLRLFQASCPLGPWREHSRSPVVTGDPRAARPGGRVVEWKGSLIRYAQVCVPRYGTDLRAFRITRLTPEEYAEEAVDAPPIARPGRTAWNSRAMHHVDPYLLPDGTWLAVADGHDHPSYAEPVPTATA
ncbi:MAG TPA: hypothetical protein VHZ74_07160 [Bryobacteraceae bacterium]|jgi:hypothetical protein|nr:hypothetical protein [Bryobacteraceae bacterium]